MQCVLLSGLFLGAAGLITTQADTILTFSVDMATNLANGTFDPPEAGNGGTDAVYVNGTFYGWNGNGVQLVEQGSSTIYTNSFDDTGDANGHCVSYRFRLVSATAGTSYESTASWDNRAAELPTVSGASLALPTPYYGDVGPGQIINVKFQVDMAEQVQLGTFTPGTSQVDVRGSFNGWGNAGDYLTNDPSIAVTNPGGVITRYVYTGTFPITSGAEVPGVPATNAYMEWKAVIDPSSTWENPGPTDSGDAGNRFWCNNTNQVLPVVSFSDMPYSIAYATVNVDMSGPILLDPNYVPNSVVIWGTFNSWANGISMTNNPAAANTNIYSAVLTMAEGTPIIIQVRYTNSLVGGFVYDYIDDSVYNNNARRIVNLPIVPGTLYTNLPVFSFLDLALDDYLTQDTPVTFSVDMNGAVGTDGHQFDPGSDNLYINGMFANGGAAFYPQTWYAWSDGINPVSAPAGFQMTQVGSSSIYTDTVIIPAGTPVGLAYQYGMDEGGLIGGPLENEAAAGANHFRVVRSTVNSPYVMATDVFTNAPYAEPVFAPGNLYNGAGTLAGGDLSVGAAAGGKIPVSWLGRPGAQLQVSSDLSGAWQNIPATDGTNWTAGYSSANGLVSVTNWPASGTTFFRLVKP